MWLKDKKRLGRILIISLITMWPLLIGAKFLDLELRNVARPLVDMTKLVNGNSITAEALEIDSTEADDSKEKSEKKQPEKEVSPRKENGIIIRISGEIIYINELGKSTASFETAFEKVYKKGMSVTVTDDYADYRAMRTVLDYLDRSGIFYSKKEMK